ncbi:MAG: tRNA pseudouridine(38-40) synthase TruA [Microlunatus sp.]|nr:tRNA pseudouridine(38-40) synthase TruA [Microlunatus sp.]MDN5803237.1 tRNA pseudouridine(38-40) synthase TruA [Microlunatus sp.]
MTASPITPSPITRCVPDPVRWRLGIRYDGSAFSGWAAQPGRRTVQGELELWLRRVLGLDQPPRLVCAGRTDAGVHARGQVAHVDLGPDTVMDPEALRWRLSRALPGDLAVTDLRRAPAGFDARFAAVWRRYCYRIADLDTIKDPLTRGFVVSIPYRLDVDRLNTAGRTLLGLRDFGAFCKRREGATTVRTLLDLSARRRDDGPEAGLVELTVRADAFCHSMVRCLAGALVEIGSARRGLDWLSAVAAAGVRSSTVRVMPAHGLTLEEVGYPPEDQLAERASQARSRRTLPGAESDRQLEPSHD